MKKLGRLDFDNQLVVNNHVESLVRDVDACVLNGDLELSRHAVTTLTQFKLERLGVHLLEEPKAQILGAPCKKLQSRSP